MECPQIERPNYFGASLLTTSLRFFDGSPWDLVVNADEPCSFPKSASLAVGRYLAWFYYRPFRRLRQELSASNVRCSHFLIESASKLVTFRQTVLC